MLAIYKVRNVGVEAIFNILFANILEKEKEVSDAIETSGCKMDVYCDCDTTWSKIPFFS